MKTRLARLFLALCALCPPAFADTLVVENGTVLTLADGQDAPFSGYLEIADGRITAIGTGVYEGPPPDRRVDAAGHIVIPGFVSGHNHLWQSPWRGIAPNGELWPWLRALHFTYADYFGDGDFYAFTLHGALDQLLHGITTTYNHAQRLGAPEARYLESLEASLAAGQHFVFAYSPRLDGTPAEVERRIAAFVDRANGTGSPLLLGLSMHSVGSYRGSPEKFALEMDLAKRYGLTVQIHYLEQYSKRFEERRKWPLFKAAGAVGPHVSYAHFIHPSETLLKEAAELGSAMIWNPLSNGRLASGLADIPHYLEVGMRVGMGVDGAASADVADPFENMRMGLYGLRMQHRNATVMRPIDMLRLHTLRTAEILEVADEVGSLEVGKRADFLLVDPSLPPTGPVSDAVATLVLASAAANIRAVYVDGERRVADGLLVDQNMVAVSADAAARVERIRERVAAAGAR